MKLFIGIDCGVNTGFAVWHKQDRMLLQVATLMIHQALELVVAYNAVNQGSMTVIIEDARQVRFNTNMAAAQGAGSVKRDAKIWQDFCTDKGIKFELVRPKKAITKLNGDLFRRLTKWQGVTTTHSRDAAMLIVGK